MATETARAIEAILMVAEGPVDAQLLAQLLEQQLDIIEATLAELMAGYEVEDRGFILTKVAGGYRYQSHPEMAAYVERFVLEGQTSRLSAAALETLAIVAYKQPISRAQVSAIRGVSVDGVIRTLEQRGYIVEIARDPGPGNPSLFGTTDMFLEKLGLDRVDDLPPIASFVPGPDVVEQLEQGLRAQIDPEVAAEIRGSSEDDGVDEGADAGAPVEAEPADPGDAVEDAPASTAEPDRAASPASPAGPTGSTMSFEAPSPDDPEDREPKGGHPAGGETSRRPALEGHAPDHPAPDEPAPKGGHPAGGDTSEHPAGRVERSAEQGADSGARVVDADAVTTEALVVRAQSDTATDGALGTAATIGSDHDGTHHDRTDHDRSRRDGAGRDDSDRDASDGEAPGRETSISGQTDASVGQTATSAGHPSDRDHPELADFQHVAPGPTTEPTEAEPTESEPTEAAVVAVLGETSPVNHANHDGYRAIEPTDAVGAMDGADREHGHDLPRR